MGIIIVWLVVEQENYEDESFVWMVTTVNIRCILNDGIKFDIFLIYLGMSVFSWWRDDLN